MMSSRLVILLLVAADILNARHSDADRCTAILVGSKASTTGSPMTTQTNDCADCDFRLVKVPAKQHPSGSLRPVILVNQPYPRFVGSTRGPVYEKSNLERGLYSWGDTTAIGYIPQVAETYGYLEGVYGIMNEHQLGIGESTCGARLWTKPITQGGKALLDITELSRIALERTKTARDAILLMGSLAEKYGYYGGSWDNENEGIEEAGEALTVTDIKEGWMFHILPDDTGTSAVWAAQRVPDNHITAIGNQFVIHHVNTSDTENYLASSNLYDVAKRNGFWDGKSVFDFTVAYAPKQPIQYGMTRRVWRVFTLANKELTLSPTTDAFATDYPFSIEPDHILSPADLMQFQRDHYEGTDFDLTQGLAAGPYGDPNRYSVGPAGDGGFFDRSISVYKATYSYVAVAHPTNPNNALLWFGPYAPSETTYVPIYPKVSAIPSYLGSGSLRQFDMSKAFWLNALVGNYASRYYRFTQPVVSAAQRKIEMKSIQAQPAIFDNIKSFANGEEAIVTYLTNVCNSFAADAHNGFNALFSTLVTQFHDGYIMSNVTGKELGVEAMGYPKWWLEAVGYFEPTRSNDSASSIGGIIGYTVLVVLAAALGFAVGQRYVRPLGYEHIK